MTDRSWHSYKKLIITKLLRLHFTMNDTLQTCCSKSVQAKQLIIILNGFVRTDDGQEKPRRNPDITTPTPRGDEAKVDGDINFTPRWASSPSCFTTSTPPSGKLLNWPDGYCTALCSNKKQNEAKKKCCSGTGQLTEAAGTKWALTFGGSWWKANGVRTNRVRGQWCLFCYRRK